MNIALLGYGKMGRLIDQLASGRGHEIVLKVDENSLSDLTKENLKKADVAIDFSTPETVIDNIKLCFDANIPVVIGTTGWYGKLQEIKNLCDAGNKTLLYASNFSIGVNVFFHANKVLAKMMNRYPQYDVQIEEIHHLQKFDSPSGTAMTIAEGIIDELDRKNEWVNQLVGQDKEVIAGHDQLLIESHRLNTVPGTHTVIYTAHSRAGFALGAVLAAEWVQNRSGFFSISDMFDFSV